MKVFICYNIAFGEVYGDLEYSLSGSYIIFRLDIYVEKSIEVFRNIPNRKIKRLFRVVSFKDSPEDTIKRNTEELIIKAKEFQWYARDIVPSTRYLYCFKGCFSEISVEDLIIVTVKKKNLVIERYKCPKCGYTGMFVTTGEHLPLQEV